MEPKQDINLNDYTDIAASFSYFARFIELVGHPTFSTHHLALAISRDI